MQLLEDEEIQRRALLLYFRLNDVDRVIGQLVEVSGKPFGLAAAELPQLLSDLGRTYGELQTFEEVVDCAVNGLEDHREDVLELLRVNVKLATFPGEKWVRLEARIEATLDELATCGACDGETVVHCSRCNGSGEGAWDGSRCSDCRGRGVVACADCYEEPDYDEDRARGFY